MLEILAAMRALLGKHDDRTALDVVNRLIALYGEDEPRFWREIQGGEVWGGAGSLADQGLSVVRSPVQADLQKDRRAFWSLMADLEAQMDVHGVSTPRARQCADGFRYWIRAGV